MTTAELRALYEHIQQHFALDYADLTRRFKAACKARGVNLKQAQQVEREMEKTLTLDGDGCYANSNFPARYELAETAEALGIDPATDEKAFVKTVDKFIDDIDYRQKIYLANVHSNGTQTQRATGRQSGARKPARRSAVKKTASSDDGDGGDGEPPRRTHSKQQEQQPPLPRFYTYAQFAEIFGITPESLRNSVSAGRFPKPLPTIFGPRFTDEHIHLALKTKNRAVTPQKKRHTPPARPAPTRPRGRPRIAQAQGKGGAA
jgi:hypothetical protein